MKIFFYWEAPNRVAMPAYLQLCLETWRRACPDADIVPVNQANLAELSGGRVDVDRLAWFTYPLQSDVAAIAVLSHQPGLFLDVDTILLPHFADVAFDPDKLTMYGSSLAQGNHCTGFFHSPKPENPLLIKWLAEANARIRNRTRGLYQLRWKLRRAIRGKAAKAPWNFLGNGILDELLRTTDYGEALDLRELDSTGAYPTARLLREHPEFAGYQELWFDPLIPVSEVIRSCRDGLVILQNSWHPESFKAASRSEVLAGDSLVSRLIRTVLTP